MKMLARGALCALLLLALHAFGQAYPTRPIRYIVPFPPGGGQDLVARALAPRLTEAMGQPVLVDNRPGAGTALGTEIAARSLPDGYTILMGSNTSHAINPHLYAKLAYDPIKDFIAITQVASLPNLLVVHPALPIRSVKELAALGKSRPAQLNYGSSGNGTPAQLAGVMFSKAAGITMVHIPYRGSGPALTALLSGETQLMFGYYHVQSAVCKRRPTAGAGSDGRKTLAGGAGTSDDRRIRLSPIRSNHVVWVVRTGGYAAGCGHTIKQRSRKTIACGGIPQMAGRSGR